MPSKDIWSYGSASQLRDVLRSALALLFFSRPDARVVYFSSPWMSDFVLFDNTFEQFCGLFPELSDTTNILFSDYLARLSQDRDVRIITVATDASRTFLASPTLRHTRLSHRFASPEYHEKGI